MDSKTLIDRISRKLNLPTEECEEMFNSLAGLLSEKGAEMDNIAVPGFGTFEPKKRLERINVHPSTGKRMLLPPKIVMSFKPSALLKQKVNN
jgi:nucleoid DNA-binding protein